MTFAANLAQSASNNQTFRNRIINGAMVIDQRGVVATTHASYVPDRFRIIKDTVAGTFTMQQSSVAPAGFRNSALFTVGTAYTPSAGENNFYRQGIEGFNISDLAWGTANAQPVTLSFWVRSSLTGTFGGSLRNGDSNRSYPFSYTISTANTWEQKSITIPGDTSGTWLTTNGIGIDVSWGLGVGSNFSGTPGSWAASNFISATGATNITSTAGATWQITGVQFEEGTAASPFENRLYGTELALCQRYFEKSLADGTAATTITNPAPTLIGAAFTTETVRTQIFYKVSKRATGTISRIPSLTAGTGSQWAWFNGGWNAGNTSVAQSNSNSFSIDVSVSSLSRYNAVIIDGNWFTDAEL
jgi:hypothetical protein